MLLAHLELQVACHDKLARVGTPVIMLLPPPTQNESTALTPLPQPFTTYPLKHAHLQLQVACQ
jgi:hypothetical protein